MPPMLFEYISDILMNIHSGMLDVYTIWADGNLCWNTLQRSNYIPAKNKLINLPCRQLGKSSMNSVHSVEWRQMLGFKFSGYYIH